MENCIGLLAWDSRTLMQVVHPVDCVYYVSCASSGLCISNYLSGLCIQ